MRVAAEPKSESVLQPLRTRCLTTGLGLRFVRWRRQGKSRRMKYIRLKEKKKTVEIPHWHINRKIFDKWVLDTSFVLGLGLPQNGIVLGRIEVFSPGRIRQVSNTVFVFGIHFSKRYSIKQSWSSRSGCRRKDGVKGERHDLPETGLAWIELKYSVRVQPWLITWRN